LDCAEFEFFFLCFGIGFFFFLVWVVFGLVWLTFFLDLLEFFSWFGFSEKLRDVVI